MVAKISRFRKTKQTSSPKAVFGWLFLGAILLFGVFLTFYNIKMYQKRAELEQRAQELRAEIAQAALRNQQLQTEIEATGTESHQEKILREQGLYKKPGEQVITVVPQEEPKTQEQEQKVWWDLFGWFQ